MSIEDSKSLRRNGESAMEDNRALSDTKEVRQVIAICAALNATLCATVAYFVLNPYPTTQKSPVPLTKPAPQKKDAGPIATNPLNDILYGAEFRELARRHGFEFSQRAGLERDMLLGSTPVPGHPRMLMTEFQQALWREIRQYDPVLAKEIEKNFDPSHQ